MNKNRASIPWDQLKSGQPFFGQIQTAGGKNNTNNFPADRKTNPASVTVPPDYPQNELYREVVAQHYDAIRKDDDFIGTVLADLKEHGLDKNTIVVYFGDHGANNLVRHKQMPTEGGLHVPFIISGPDKYLPAASVRDDLVNLLDLSATTLAWAGVKQPEWYEGQYLFGDRIVPREAVFGAKDRLDHTIDRVRTVRTDRFRYTRNFKTDRVFLQPQYRDSKDYVKNLRELYASGELSPKLTEIYFGERPAEEFYDVKADPSQLHNLANDPKFADELQRHRDLLTAWIAKGDMGEGEESNEEIAFQAKSKKWRVVNPEYEAVRIDSDGDGLSDEWEKYNDRDPADGKLMFTFNCGGWQTEGWRGDEALGNIAGRQGFLDFALPDGKGTITRSGLSIKPAKNTGYLTITMRTTEPVEVEVSCKSAGKEFQTLFTAKCHGDASISASLPSNKAWQGTIESLQLEFSGEPKTLVEIDSIEVK